MPRRITVDEFEAMHRAGRWHEDDRIELINGEIRPMSPINDPHIGCVDRLNWLFSRRFGDDVIIHVQNPVRLDPYNEPPPDVTVLREYWVVDLNHELIHVHSQPDTATGQYQHVSAASRERALAVRFAPGIVFSVDEILG